MVAIEQYSTLAENLETIVCFLDLHEIKLFHKKTQYSVKDFLVFGHPTQSSSQNSFNRKSELAGK